MFIKSVLAKFSLKNQKAYSVNSGALTEKHLKILDTF